MTTNQLFVRDFTLMAAGLTVVIAVALALAPGPVADHATPIAVAPHGPPGAGFGARLYRSKGCVTRPGYPPSMPSFEGILNDREIEGLSAYVESLR